MNLRNKIIWFAVAPLLVALSSIAFTVYHRAALLEQQQRQSIERAYRDSKDIELKNYSTLAEQSIAHLYDSGRADAATMDEAKTILRSLNYGPDGYFFLFDLEGTFLMHPHQPELVGQNLWDLRDINGNPSIQRLISRALEGGGFLDYMWQKPTNQSAVPVPKRAYVFVLENWGWVLGTGVYLDDINAALAKLDKQASLNIFDTMLWITLISSLSVIAIVSGLMWSIRGRSIVDAQLSALTQRIIKTQEEERTRIANALHDSIKPMLVVIKMKIELGIYRLYRLTQEHPQKPADAQNTFKEAISLVDDTLADINRVVHDLRPFNLESLGLEGALHLCVHHFDSDAMQVELSTLGKMNELPSTAEQALFLVAKEAIANATKYSSAKRVSIRLENNSRCVMLAIHDDGHGFDLDHVNDDPNRGLGLRNMRERIEAENGVFQLTSSTNGTSVIATIPLH
ncbi:cache domain-containing protein [Nitrosomonas sp. Is37]|uniref:cache domain-containing protein n=1 Tax=Nitrosomonas sp. Is37 TaxID=3080535 RepID=UPI00294AF639|nr:cache domain-containing protein [Nitrosomonas sp. Is37]MDV6345350.1 cache domain-containing protein [Nitrosomonas sp. Is37]